MKLKKQIGGNIIVANYSGVNESLVNAVLDKLTDLNNKGPELKDGSKIRFGWSLLTLKQINGELVICEPDFLNEPFENVSPGISVTMNVLIQQSKILNQIGHQAEDCNFDSKIVIEKDSLLNNNFYLKRSNKISAEDSGWFIGRTDTLSGDYKTEDLESIYAFQLLKLKPDLMKILTLPIGFLVLFENSKLTAIINEQNENLYHNI